MYGVFETSNVSSGHSTHHQGLLKQWDLKRVLRGWLIKAENRNVGGKC